MDGYPVRVKRSPGRIKAEHDDAARVAARTGRPVREVARRAEEQAYREISGGGGPAAPGSGGGSGSWGAGSRGAGPRGGTAGAGFGSEAGADGRGDTWGSGAPGDTRGAGPGGSPTEGGAEGLGASPARADPPRLLPPEGDAS